MQTSFRKKQRPSSSAQQLNGTQPSLHNGQLLCSTGVPSLDAVLGGGIPVGSVFLLEEDFANQYSCLLTRYFLAEGVMSCHGMLLATSDDGSSLLNHLPEPIVLDNESQTPKAADDMEIAWRYQNSPQIQTSMGKYSKYGHYYDISKSMDSNRLNNAKHVSLDIKNVYFDHCSEKKTFDIFRHVLREIHKYIHENNFDIANAVKSKKTLNILRVAIPEFWSPFWRCNGENEFDICSVLQFLNCLRTIMRNSLAICWVTAPTHIHSSKDIEVIRHNVDTVIRLESFGRGKTNPLYKEYHGLLKIEKLPTLNCLMPYMPDTYDLAFKVRRKKFSVERLHLPPDIGETVSRQGVEEETGVQSMCASGAKSAIDF